MRSTAAIRKGKTVAGLLAGVMISGAGQAQLSLPGLPQLPLPDDGGAAESLTGEASAVTTVVLGSVTRLAATGTLDDASQPLGTGVGAGSIAGLVSAEALHATTMAWPDRVASEASLGSLAMTVAGTGISADFVLSRAQAVSGGAPTGLSAIEGLSIAGMPIALTGAPNQVISLPGLSVTLNEQIPSAGGIVVNALHVRTLDGLTDVVVGSTKAGI